MNKSVDYDSYLSLFGFSHQFSSDQPKWEQRTKLTHMKSPGKRVTTPEPLDSWGKPWSLYLSRLEDAIQGANMVRSLYVQIGALNYQSLITVSATGVQNKNVWLTFQFKRGPLFQTHRFRGASLKSRSNMPVAPIVITNQMFIQRPWWKRLWDFLTRV